MVPRPNNEQWRFLEASPEFQRVFAADPVLDHLEEEMRNPEIIRQELALILGASLVIELDGRAFPAAPPSPGVIALWYLARSPLLLPSVEWRDDDELIALYLLLKGRQAPLDDQETLRRAASAFFEGVDRKCCRRLRDDLHDMLRLAWHPYAMLPRPAKIRSGDTPPSDPVFDSDWLTALAARVANVTNLDPERIIWNMPMVTAAAYDLQFRRYVLHQQHIARRPDNSAAAAAYWERVYQLAADFLKTSSDHH